MQEPSIPKRGGRLIDISPLLWWGQVRIIMERVQTASFRPAATFVQISKRLEEFDPAKDYIAVAGGDNLAVLLVGAILARRGHCHFNYLRFDRSYLPDGSRDPSSGFYIPVYVPLTPAAAVDHTSP